MEGVLAAAPVSHFTRMCTLSHILQASPLAYSCFYRMAAQWNVACLVVDGLRQRIVIRFWDEIIVFLPEAASMKLHIAVFVSSLLLTAACFAGDKEGWRIYHSPDYGFSIRYPADMTFYPGHPDYGETQLSYIPICEYSTVACFEYNGKEYEGTNFEAAGVSVNVLRDMRTEQACGKIDTGSSPVRTVKINGVTFHWGITGEGLMSQFKGGPTYHVFHQNVCFEIVAATAQANMGAFEPGAVEAFDSARLDALLDKMVHTFKFETKVKDGPRWKVYYDNMCGGIYEYPEDETVQTTIEYSQDDYYSNDITCSRNFKRQGRVYTVEVRVNLKDKNQLNTWLTSSIYPDLTKARLIVSSTRCSEYRAGTYYYIFCQGAVYILGVSDVKNRIVDPDNDAVFTHLLNSFKVQ